MAKEKLLSQKAAGKLVSSIQKEWGNELGLDSKEADISESVMDLAHGLLQANTADNMQELMGARSVYQYLGEIWVKKHPSINPAIECLIQAMEQEIT